MAHYTIGLWEQMRFTDRSPTAKRIVAAAWMNRGKPLTEDARLTSADRGRIGKIMDEEGFEVLQDILATTDELRAENRRLRRRLADVQRGLVG
ncbi:hypothetical protein ACNPMH_16200 [Enterococcus faecium]|uniref:hypothetical protein n=1 Tax=Enterococcus faecium TaxID=1352 RepID=UPI003AAB3829